MESRGQQSRAKDGSGAAAAALFVGLATVYALSPVVNVGDARYTILLASTCAGTATPSDRPFDNFIVTSVLLEPHNFGTLPDRLRQGPTRSCWAA